MKEKGKKWDNKFVGGKAHKELVGRERKREITELTRGQAGVGRGYGNHGMRGRMKL